jgi:hypothetical protein
LGCSSYRTSIERALTFYLAVIPYILLWRISNIFQFLFSSTQLWGRCCSVAIGDNLIKSIPFYSDTRVLYDPVRGLQATTKLTHITPRRFRTPGNMVGERCEPRSGHDLAYHCWAVLLSRSPSQIYPLSYTTPRCSLAMRNVT